jgi:gliding motility-associated-like protein
MLHSILNNSYLLNKPVFYILLGLWLCVSFQFPVRAQENLVPNGSFEEYYACPIQTGEIHKLKNWFNPTSTTPDFFHSCSNTEFAGIPVNLYGVREAQHGNAYCGIVNNTIDEFREYLAVELSDYLEVGATYRFSMFVTASEVYYNPSNNLSVLFLENIDGLIENNQLPSGTPILTNTPSIIWTEPIYDSSGWHEISGYYTASGCEKFIVIGNFSIPYSTVFFVTDSLVESYYFIDNVTLKKQESNTEILPNVFTPNGDGVNDYFQINLPNLIVFEVLNRWGQIIYNSTSEINWDGKIDGFDATDGVYFFRLEITVCGKENIIKTGFVHLVR